MKITILGVTISTESSEDKRFGLPQAEGAMQFANSSDQAKAILGVVVGVLGYENKVGEDVANATADAQADVQAAENGIAMTEAKIAALEARIAQLKEGIAASKDRQSELQDVAKLFAVQPAGK